MAADDKLWLIPLTILATAYVKVSKDTDEATVAEIARDGVTLRGCSLGVTVDLDSTLVGEPVESVVPGETLDREEGKEVEDAVRRQSHLPYIV